MSFEYTDDIIDTRGSSAPRFIATLSDRWRILTAGAIAVALIGAISWLLLHQMLTIKDAKEENLALKDNLQSLRHEHFETLVTRIFDMPFDPRAQDKLRSTAHSFANKQYGEGLKNTAIASQDTGVLGPQSIVSVKIINSTSGENYRHVDMRVEDPATRQFIQNLSRRDFELTVGGTRVSQAIVQKVETSLEKRAIAIVQDKSSSMRGLPDTHATHAIAAFVKTCAGSSTRVKIWKFADSVKAASVWTSDKDLLLEACKEEPPQGRTALYAALDAVVDDLSQRSELKTILLLTDGTDSNAATIPSGIAEQCRMSNITVYVVGLKSDSLNEQVLKQLTTATGGTYFLANESTQISSRFKEVSQRVFVPAYRILAFIPDNTQSPLRIEVGNSSVEVY